MSNHTIDDTSWTEVKDGEGVVDLVATGLAFYMQSTTPIADSQPIPPEPPLGVGVEWLVPGGRIRRLKVLAGLKGYCRCVQGSGTVEVTEVS